MDANDSEMEAALSRVMGSEEEVRMRLKTHLDTIGLGHLIVG